MSEYSQKVSFWDLLKRKNIVIPIIQRDYAQGRKGKEFLRERFLKQLFDASVFSSNCSTPCKTMPNRWYWTLYMAVRRKTPSIRWTASSDSLPSGCCTGIWHCAQARCPRIKTY